MVKSLRITDTVYSNRSTYHLLGCEVATIPSPRAAKRKKKEVENPHCKMPMPMLITISKAS